MQLIKLDATESTNTYLKNLMGTKHLVDYTVVTTLKQTKGRGQRNGNWVSEAGKNLTFSVLKNKLNLNIDSSFLISAGVSLAILDSLRSLKVPDIKIKWPNDIMSGNQKIGGILIENTFAGLQIKNTIVGIGLNVNQTEFGQLRHASSLACLTGTTFNLDTVLEMVVKHLKIRFKSVDLEDQEDVLKEYHEKLFKKDISSSFLDDKGQKFTGKIIGVTNTGKLCIDSKAFGKKEYDLKEVKFIL